MIVSVQEARNILGSKGEDYSDDQIEEVLNLFVALSDLAIDSYLEKKKLRKEVSTGE
jgi:hypothetical protein